MQKRHLDKELYFSEQAKTTEKFVIPFIQKKAPINKETSVLEIGCGEGGNLKPFLDIGCRRIVGVDISKSKIESGQKIYKNLLHPEKIEFIVDDIYNIKNIGKFDLIITRDVLEHIHGQENFMRFIKKFLNPNGKVFLGFPPWYNPFGGHQQICKSKVLSKLPFFHIFPRLIYKTILKSFGENDKTVHDLLEIKETGISIEQFEKILKKENYIKELLTFYFINPNYETKFGLKPREVFPIISIIPFFRNFFITASYYLVTTTTE